PHSRQQSTSPSDELLLAETTTQPTDIGNGNMADTTVLQRQQQQPHRETAKPVSKKSTVTGAAAATAARLATAALALTAASAATYEVSPDGDPMTLTAALEVAGAGDTISLGDGIYREPLVTMNAGVEGNPLVIEGGRGAVINYFTGDKSMMWSQKVVDIRHSWVTLRVRGKDL
ncbi:unnamed protein product, partial [Ectocarpus sp. 13 AM-2016]